MTGKTLPSKINLLVISSPDHRVSRNLEALRDCCEYFISDDNQELEKMAPRAEVILFAGSSGKPVNFPQVWQQASSVQWIHSLSAGVEKLLFPALVDSKVTLTNARGVYKRSLAEFAVLGILFHYKRVRRLLNSQRQHKWDNFATEFANERVMGVVGYGETGRECALLGKALGLTIHGLRRNPERSAKDAILDRIFKPDELQLMLSGIDVLLCAAPLTPDTHHLIGAAEFAVMKPTAIVVNVGRGEVIDEAAMIRALQNKTIAGASLDVFEKEPLPEISPLWDMENVLISPHCTDYTENPDAVDLTMRFFVENLRRYRKGEPLENIVDKKAGY